MATFSKPPFLQQVDKNLPVLLYAVALQKATATVGFDWPDTEGVLAKIAEELQEVSEEITLNAPREKIQEELGDLLFACTNLARHLNIDPQIALAQCNQKFIRRFTYIEQRVLETNQQLSECTLEQLDGYWDDAKRDEQQ